MKLQVNFSGITLLYAAALLLILPLKWVFAVVFSALFHELCHYLAVGFVNGSVYGVAVSHQGAVMNTCNLTKKQEFFCVLAGPAGSILLFFCYPWIPRISLCAGIQGIFNLLPVYPLDGGRVFRIILSYLMPDRIAEKLFRSIEIITIILTFGAGCFCSVQLNSGISPLLLTLLLVFRALPEKFLAKKEDKEYNSLTK